MTSRIRHLLVVTTCIWSGAAADSRGKAEFGFGEAVAKHFVMPPAPQHVHDVAEGTGKPSMVMLCSKVSPHSNMLKKSIREGTKVKALLDKFNVAYADENVNLWQDASETYVPQVLFFSSGGLKMPIVGHDPKHKHMYTDERQLEKSMLEALSLASTWSSNSGGCDRAGCHGSNECCQIDDSDFCLATAGCKWGFANDEDDPDFDPDFDLDNDEGPCAGGSQCKEIDDKDMCEFTDGCKWTFDGDSLETEVRSSMEAKGSFAGLVNSGGDNEEEKPHSFGDDVTEMIIAQPSLAEMREAAAESKKPFIVILTLPKCTACEALAVDVSYDNRVKKLFEYFVIGHAFADEGVRNWQARGEAYAPQTYFFDQHGTPLNVYSPSQSRGFKHFFMHGDELAQGMTAALEKLGMRSEL